MYDDYDDDDDYDEVEEERDELEDMLEPEVQPETGFQNFIIVDGLPVVGPEKIDKLKKVITKIYSQVSPAKEVVIFMPQDQKTNMTKGYAFLELPSFEAANLAVQQTNGFKLDHKHTFVVNHYDDFARFAEIPEEYVAPQPKPYEEKINLKSWLMDDRSLAGLEQYVVRHTDETEIYWFNPKDTAKPQAFANRRHWTDSYVQWSPQGTYLVTFHHQGLILWGNEGWQKIMRFQHPHVKLADFSPNEKYLITFSAQFQENDDPKDPQCIIVWDIKTGKKLRGFVAQNSAWPAFKWSFDDNYFARLGKDMISVYETPSMNLLNKKSIKCPEIKDFCWSPSQNIISYWTPEQANNPARVSLIAIPSRQEIRSKTLFNVTDCKMHWQNKGDYLCVKVDRHSKTKKSTFTNFELFRMREKDIPIEVLELKQNILAFSWEPKGSRFAIIHAAESGPRPDVSFYKLTKTKVDLLVTLEKRPANHLFWSPTGSNIVLAGLRNFHGALEFYNVDELHSMRVEEHPMATDVEWDPSGRLLVTSVSAWRHQLENGYIIWNFQGKLIQKVMKDRFFQLLWRPRPASLLTEEQEKEIRENLSKYSKDYNVQDSQQRDAAREELRKKRMEMRSAFESYLAEKRAEYTAEKNLRVQLRSGVDVDDESNFEYLKEDVEELIETREQIL